MPRKRTKRTLEEKQAILAELETVPLGQKGDWLKARGLVRSVVDRWAAGKGLGLPSGQPSVKLEKRKQRRSRKVVPVSTPKATGGVSLREAIQILRAKQTAMAEVIEQLEAMEKICR